MISGHKRGDVVPNIMSDQISVNTLRILKGAASARPSTKRALLASSSPASAISKYLLLISVNDSLALFSPACSGYGLYAKSAHVVGGPQPYQVMAQRK